MGNVLKFGYTSIPYIFIGFCGVILQILLLNGFSKDPLKCFKNPGTFLVANLAVADMFVCLTAIAVDNCLPMKWSYWIALPPHILSMASSVLTITSIAIDRFLMVAYPLKHRHFMKAKIRIFWLASIWLLAAVYPAMIFIRWEKKHFYIVANSSGMLMFSITAILYALTYYKLKKQSQNLRQQNCTPTESRPQHLRILREKRFLNTIIIITSIFVLCMVPVSIFQLHVVVKNFTNEGTVVKVFTIILNSIFYLNFAVNPLIYVVRLPNYRKTFQRLYYKSSIFT